MRNRVLGVAVLALVVLGGACGGVDGGADASRCDGERGSARDVAGEPDWRAYADYRPWTDAEGCLVRIDVLAERAGPAHCGWQDADVIITGNPLGGRYTTAADSLNFVRDPDSVFGRPELADGFDGDAALPAEAIDSGFRRGDVALWHVPGDDSAVWLVSGTHAERWPRGDPPLCA